MDRINIKTTFFVPYFPVLHKKFPLCTDFSFVCEQICWKLRISLMQNLVCVVEVKFMDINCKLLYSLGIKRKTEQRNGRLFVCTEAAIYYCSLLSGFLQPTILLKKRLQGRLFLVNLEQFFR